MSGESATEFVRRLYDCEDDMLALLPKGVVPEGIGSAEIASISNAARRAGWDFTAEELSDAYLDSLTLDERELSTVAGGDPCAICPNVAQEPHRGGCSSNYYAEQCLDTVSDQDGCNCTDWDTHADHYHRC